MKIFLGSDHRGYQLKKKITKILDKQEKVYEDMGCDTDGEKCDYTEFGSKVANEVAKSSCHRGIVICGSGVGISIAANRVKGVRALRSHNTDLIQIAREHNNINILALGADFAFDNSLEEIIATFLDSPTSLIDRYIKRQEQLDKI